MVPSFRGIPPNQTVTTRCLICGVGDTVEIRKIGAAKFRISQRVFPARGSRSLSNEMRLVFADALDKTCRKIEADGNVVVRGNIEVTSSANLGSSTTSQRQVPPRTRQSGRSGCAIAFFFTVIAVSIIGVLGYRYYAAKPAKIPEAQIPQISRVSTYQRGALVYFRLYYRDPGHHAEGFGFVGVNGSGWAEENHSFSSPSYGIPGPGRIDYPFNLDCGTGNEYQSDVQAWINDTAGDRSKPITIHLTCKH